MTETPPPARRSFLKVIFLSPNEPRLRAGWRLAIQLILMLALLVGFGVPVAVASLVLPHGLTETDALLLNTLIELVAFTASVSLCRRFLDRRSFASLGLQPDRQTAWDLLAGIVIPFVMMGLIYAGMALAGWIQFSGFAWQSDRLPVVLGQTLLFFVLFAVVGWQEELLFRGYHLQTLASGTDPLWGVVLSSLIFGVMHLSNANSNWAAVVGIFFAGLFLALGYLLTGKLWLSIGLHLGWNFCEGVVFGFPVSGMPVYPLLHIRVDGPAVWTGGAFGPEAGLVILPGLLVGAALVALYCRKVRRAASTGA